MKEVIVAKSAGFCFGVQRAVDTVYNQCGGKNVFTYGPIIHNEEVVKDLENKGVHVINSADEINDDSTVIIRSHGVSKDVYDSLHEKNVNIVVLDMPLLDTRSTGDNLTGTFVADLVLQILSYVAQTERENIRQRQREGIEAARMRGVRFGRPRKEIPENFEILKHQWQQNLIASRQAAKELGVSQDTFLRWAHGK